MINLLLLWLIAMLPAIAVAEGSKIIAVFGQRSWAATSSYHVAPNEQQLIAAKRMNGVKISSSGSTITNESSATSHLMMDAKAGVGARRGESVASGRRQGGSAIARGK